MRKKVNKLLTILLALTIFLNSFNVVYASEENKTSLGSDASVEMEVEGTDSVGEMLASEIQTQKDERFQNEGNCIMSLKFEGEDKDDDQSSRNVACVSFSVKSEAQLIVGVILSILVYTLFSRMFDLMQPPAVKHSIAVV